MRVLWLTNIPLPAVRRAQGLDPLTGGGWLESAARAVVAADPSIDLVCAARTWPAPEPFDDEGVRYVSLPVPEPARRFRAAAREWKTTLSPEIPTEQIRTLVADIEPDLLHLHGSETPHALATMQAAGDTPTLVSIQGAVSRYDRPFWDSMTTKMRVRDVLTKDFLRGQGLVHAGLRMSRASARERIILGQAREIGGRTAWDRDVARELSPDARYWHLDEVLRATFYRARWSETERAVPVLLTASSAAPYKGLDVLLRAYAKVVERTPCELHIAGDIQGSPLWPSLARLESDLGIAGRVAWLGGLPAAELAERMATCSAFVCASIIENSSNSVCEAMLVGAPTIASDSGGIPSLITHDRDGLLFAAGDAAALAEQVGRVLDDRQSAVGLGEAARERAAERHDPERIGRDMLEAYATIIRGDAR